MGAIANCCSRQSIIQSSSISIYSMSESEQLNTNDLYKDLIPTILDVNHALNFTTSKEYYTLLLKNIPKHIISKKICNKLNNSEIITLINKLLDWIISENIDDCDESSKQKINLIKENSKSGLKYILKELKDVKFGESLDIYILQALTSTSLISQIVLFLKSQNNPSNSEDFRFKTHVQEHMDITDKMKDMHNKVVFTESHEKELDILEKGFDKLTKDVEELKEKVDLLVSEMIKLKNTHS